MIGNVLAMKYFGQPKEKGWKDSIVYGIMVFVGLWIANAGLIYFATALGAIAAIVSLALVFVVPYLIAERYYKKKNAIAIVLWGVAINFILGILFGILGILALIGFVKLA